MSDFDRWQIVAYQDCDLPYHSITASVGLDPMTVYKIRNRRVLSLTAETLDTLPTCMVQSQYETESRTQNLCF